MNVLNEVSQNPGSPAAPARGVTAAFANPLAGIGHVADVGSDVLNSWTGGAKYAPLSRGIGLGSGSPEPTAPTPASVAPGSPQGRNVPSAAMALRQGIQNFVPGLFGLTPELALQRGMITPDQYINLGGTGSNINTEDLRYGTLEEAQQAGYLQYRQAPVTDADSGEVIQEGGYQSTLRPGPVGGSNIPYSDMGMDQKQFDEFAGVYEEALRNGLAGNDAMMFARLLMQMQ